MGARGRVCVCPCVHMQVSECVVVSVCVYVCGCGRFFVGVCACGCVGVCAVRPSCVHMCVSAAVRVCLRVYLYLRVGHRRRRSHAADHVKPSSTVRPPLADGGGGGTGLRLDPPSGPHPMTHTLPRTPLPHWGPPAAHPEGFRSQ